MRTIARTATVAMLIGAGAVLVGVQPASTADLGATTRGAPSATRPGDPGWCDPGLNESAEVRTCIFLDVLNDGDRHDTWARARIQDVAGGRNFDVDVAFVKVQYFSRPAQQWVDIRPDGVKVERHYEDVTDRLRTDNGVSCGGQGTKAFRAVGRYRFKRHDGAVTTYQWMHTAPFSVPCEH
jgi:hypothetical protein